MIANAHFKIGLFAIAFVAAVVATSIGLGWRRTHEATVRYETYFDETIQGLDLGAPVKYRGVTIGKVAEIGVAPDRRHIRVRLGIARSATRRLDLDRIQGAVRAQLATQGVTGVRFIDIDLPDAPSPPPRLSFTPGEPYIPSRPSLLGGLQLDVQATARDLPPLIERMNATLHKLGGYRSPAATTPPRRRRSPSSPASRATRLAGTHDGTSVVERTTNRRRKPVVKHHERVANAERVDARPVVTKPPMSRHHSPSRSRRTLAA